MVKTNNSLQKTPANSGLFRHRCLISHDDGKVTVTRIISVVSCMNQMGLCQKNIVKPGWWWPKWFVWLVWTRWRPQKSHKHNTTSWTQSLSIWKVLDALSHFFRESMLNVAFCKKVAFLLFLGGFKPFGLEVFQGVGWNLRHTKSFQNICSEQTTQRKLSSFQNMSHFMATFRGKRQKRQRHVLFTHLGTYIHTYIHNITLHYITLHYITLHYITLHSQLFKTSALLSSRWFFRAFNFHPPKISLGVPNQLFYRSNQRSLGKFHGIFAAGVQNDGQQKPGGNKNGKQTKILAEKKRNCEHV